MKKYSKLSFVLVGVMTLALFVGCRKKKDTIVLINVKTSVFAPDKPVDNAKVVLYAVSSTGHQSSVTIHDTAYTTPNGSAYFNFNDVYQLGQAGVAVLNIKATKDNMSGEGIIKVEEEKTSSQKVYIQ